MNESNAVTSTPRLVSQLLFGDEQNWHRDVVLLYKTNLSSSSFSFSPPVLCCVLRAVLLCCCALCRLGICTSTTQRSTQCGNVVQKMCYHQTALFPTRTISTSTSTVRTRWYSTVVYFLYMMTSETVRTCIT